MDDGSGPPKFELGSTLVVARPLEAGNDVVISSLSSFALVTAAVAILFATDDTVEPIAMVTSNVVDVVNISPVALAFVVDSYADTFDIVDLE